MENTSFFRPIIIIDSDHPTLMELYGSICAGRNSKIGCTILFASLKIVEDSQKRKKKVLTPRKSEDKKDLKEEIYFKIK